ncbi:DNA polymerase IV [Nocardioides sp. DS6]|uniref:DNA polymerase IV n=1 Tax=Nocardioides eburneus TaxID=3231482 RepID=A0ABV3T0P6_9ACTN
MSAASAPKTPILHVDMDAFFVSVAIRDRPELRDVPAAVGGGPRGVVTCANYAARAFGVRSAMSGVQARRLCPPLVSVPLDHDLVSQVSAAVREIFGRFTPSVEMVSVDEAFLDVRSAVRLLGSPVTIAERIRAEVLAEQRITCSVGVAMSRGVAKVASRHAKPDGVVVVPPEELTTFLHPLDVGELYGVGPKARARLHRLGFSTVGDLATTPLPVLVQALGPGSAARLHRLAHGTDGDGRSAPRRPLETDRSIGAQETFGRDLHAGRDRAAIVSELLRLSARVGRRVRAAGCVGRTVTLTVRFADFRTITRSRTLTQPTDVTQEVHATAVGLYDALSVGDDSRLRLVGVRVEGLLPRERTPRQGMLGERRRGWRDADLAVDRAVERFGKGVVGPASLLR